MKGVILAAGYGERLRPLTLDMPKVRLEIGGRPLIHYSLDALHQAGVSDIAVVVGYQAEKLLGPLERTHPDVETIFNDDYDGGNALSIYAARSFVADEPFIVCMGDHPIDPEIVHSLLSHRNHAGHCVLCIDIHAQHPSQLNDATRVLVDSAGYITSIGKQLKVWNAIDTGVFMMTPEVFPALDSLIAERGADVGITDMVRLIGDGGRPFATCDVSGMFWADVDTLEDYRSVEILMRETYGERI